MMNRIEKMVVLGMTVAIMAGTCVVPAKAEVISGLDTAEETFFGGSSGTSSDVNSSEDNFFDDSDQNGASSSTGNNDGSGNTENTENIGNADNTVAVPSNPVSNTTTSNSNNTSMCYYYYTNPTSTTTPPAQTSEKKSEQITLNGTQASKVETVSLKKPQIATVVSKKRAVVVCLKRSVSGASGYQIQCCKSKNFKNVTQLRTVLTTKTVNTNASGTFYVRVRAYKIANGKTYYSGWSTVKTVKIK